MGDFSAKQHRSLGFSGNLCGQTNAAARLSKGQSRAFRSPQGLRVQKRKDDLGAGLTVLVPQVRLI